MKTAPGSASLKNRLDSFCRSNHIRMLYAFGSRCAEIRKALYGSGHLQPDSESDADIAVKLSAGRLLSTREKEELAIDLERIMGVGRVDLLVLEETDPFVAVNIIRGERLFCSYDFEADEYELYVLRRAGDLAYFEKARIASIMNSPDTGQSSL